jgi:hypothetical protein
VTSVRRRVVVRNFSCCCTTRAKRMTEPFLQTRSFSHDNHNGKIFSRHLDSGYIRFAINLVLHLHATRTSSNNRDLPDTCFEESLSLNTTPLTRILWTPTVPYTLVDVDRGVAKRAFRKTAKECIEHMRTMTCTASRLPVHSFPRIFGRHGSITS